GDDTDTIHYDAALAVENGRVALIGPSPDVRARYPGAELVEGVGCAIFPGFANTHTHLSRVLARGIYEDLSPPHTPPFTGGLAPPTGACRSVWRRGPPTCARPSCSGACASCRMSSACSPPCI